ncbi:ESX secretion-associated protein EspG [Amycolatopsis nigrescens]|uniref:ESX secretion-associated protein EspG n=1 Tax=Amycolatopsis nigrescens TaxID=381445 RepID=UPI0003608850|nr:ESX secretion-associated protein EspG [Amycolatopsis nigrescens]
MIRVSASAFDILCQDLGHRVPPGPLLVRSVGSTEQERVEIRESVYDNLAERGLVTGGTLDNVLAERLETLATATVYVECEAMTDLTAESPLRAVAAARGRRAVLAAQPSKTIGLSAIRDGELYSAVVGLLPELEPGPGYGVSLPAAVLNGAVEDPVFGGENTGNGGGAAGAGSGTYEKQLREVLAIQARPVLGAGQFSVRVRDQEGRLRRAGGVSWFVTDVGAYLGTVEEGRGGRDWVSVAPVDSPKLAARLADIAAEA